MEKVSDFSSLCWVFTLDNLYETHKRCRRGKQHKREVVDFEIDLNKNLLRLQKSIFDKSYSVDKYRTFKIYEPKERVIESLSYKDRIVQNCLCNELLKVYFERKFIYTNGACRECKGTDFCRDKLKEYLIDYHKRYGVEGYALKCDIAKYFASIDYDILERKMARIFDKDTLWLLRKFIRVGERDKGIPIGNQTSQWFALFYLNEIDHFIKKTLKIKYYIRYMDDFILIHHDKNHLRYALGEISKKLSSIKLSFNRKTKIHKLQEGIKFLGFRYRLSHTGKICISLMHDAKNRIKRNVAKNKVKKAIHFITRKEEREYTSNCLKFYNRITEQRFVDRVRLCS